MIEDPSASFFPTATPLRSYQARLVDSVKRRSAIVVLPTGAGKTLIAAAVISHFLQTKTAKVLFLVPTRLLVSQQAASLLFETNRNVREYQGGNAAPQDFDILVSTPAAFLLLSEKKAESFSLQHFGLVVFDEIHHVIKQHPYRSIARRISCQTAPPSSSSSIQILGLTASLTYAMTEAGISKAIHELTVELSLQPGGIVTSTTEELQQGGYHATVCQTDVHSGIDVSAREMSALEIPGMVHQALADFLDHVRENKAPIHPLSISLMEAIASLEVSIKTRDGNFESPVGQKGAKGRLAEWGVYAHAQRKKAKSGSALDARYELLEHLYEAARIIINSRQLSLELAFQYLLMVGVLPSQITSATCTTSISMLADCWDEHKDDLSTRLNDLADVLAAQVDKHPDGALRCIVFVQKRISTHIVKYFIETHPDPALCGLSCGVLYASSSPATASLSINPTESRRVLSAFSTGEIAVLVSTCVAEEGMDVPAANCVVRFDPLQNPVSMVQGRGRARQAESSFVVMAESAKRKLSSLQDSEEHQKNVISRSSAMQEKTADIIAKMIQAQLSRVSGAAVLLTKYAAELVAGDTTAPTHSLGQLKAYASKVKGEVTEKVVPRQIQGGPSFAAEVTLDQFHVGRAVGQGTGATKQKAVHSASHDLLLRIIRNL